MVNTRRSSVGLNAEVRETTTSEESFSTSCSPQSFWKRVNKLSENQKKAIEKTGFGNLLKIPGHTLSKNLLAELMERWHPEKRAFLIVPKENTSEINIKITLTDVALVLGLPVTGTPVILREDEPFSDLEKEYGATLEKRKITVASIEKTLDSFGDAVNDKFIRLFLLFTFGKLLFPSTDSKVDSRFLSLFKDLGKVPNFSWGVALLKDLTNWLCQRKEKSDQVLGGCLIFLQIWSYEHIDLARPKLRAGEELGCPTIFPRACRWENNKPKPRQWFRTKFKELDKDQVVCELKLSPQESKIDIIKAIYKVDKNQARLNIMDQWIAEISQESDLIVVGEVQRTERECLDQLRGQIDTPQSTSQDNSLSVLINNDDDEEEENIASVQQKNDEKDENMGNTQQKFVKEDENIANMQQKDKEEEENFDMQRRDDTKNDDFANTQLKDDDEEDNIAFTQQKDYKEGENIANTQLKDSEEENNISNIQQALLKEIAELKIDNDGLKKENKMINDHLDQKNAELRNLRKEKIEVKKEKGIMMEENKTMKDHLEEVNAELRNLRTELRNLGEENKFLKDELKEQNQKMDDLRKEKQHASSSSEGLVNELDIMKKENKGLREENKIVKDQLEEESAKLRKLREENKVLKDELEEQNEKMNDLRKGKQGPSSSSEDFLTELEVIIQNLISPKSSLLD